MLLAILAVTTVAAGDEVPLVIRAQASAETEKVDSIAKAAIDERHLPGLSLAVVREGKVAMARGYGLNDVEQKVPATADSVYEIGSVTKQFTAMAIMMLVEQGKVSLDEKITAYLSGLPDAWKDVTVRHLLTHTSGIKSFTSVPDFGKITTTPCDQKRLVELLTPYPLQFEPGTKWSYCNTGYRLLGWIIEKQSGLSYADFLKERIFVPLKMTATKVGDPGRANIPPVGYVSHSGNSYQKAGYTDMSWPSSAGAIVSSVADMAQWSLALDEKKFLTPASYKEMWTPVRLKGGGTAGYGFGWDIGKTSNGHTMILHSGHIPGFQSIIVRYPEDHLTVIVLINADFGSPGAVASQLAMAFEPSLRLAK